MEEEVTESPGSRINGRSGRPLQGDMRPGLKDQQSSLLWWVMTNPAQRLPVTIWLAPELPRTPSSRTAFERKYASIMLWGLFALLEQKEAPNLFLQKSAVPNFRSVFNTVSICASFTQTCWVALVKALIHRAWVLKSKTAIIIPTS